ncbi:MAG: zinc-binding dehydrogenase [Bacteroidota bacterium]
MKAILFQQHGGPEVLKYGEVPTPTFGPNEVLVELKAAALNHLDLWIRRGIPNWPTPLPHIPGSDGSGIVSEIGIGVSNVKVGDRVLISPGLSCGTCSACRAGDDNVCSTYHVLGMKEHGTYAEFVKVPASNVLPIPEGLSFEEAAAVPLVFLTAWHMLVGLAKVQTGECVLVHGAGSGVGSAAIQIAKMFSARIITTAGSNEKLEKAKQLGADETVNYRTTDFVAEVRRLTAKQGVDIVIEHIGGEVFTKSITLLRRKGRMVTCGVTAGGIVSADLRYMFSRHLTVYGSFMGRTSELIRVLSFFPSRQLKPVVDSVFPLAQAAEAHSRMEERKHFGKIVLRVGE